MAEAALAILAKAPIPGFAKTRLISTLGAEGAALLQDRLIRHTLATALASKLRPITLWCAPNAQHPFFAAIQGLADIGLADQPEGDLGARMAAAFAASGGPLVLIGTDCPVLRAVDLDAAAEALACHDAALAPAEDGGYGLIALRRPATILFGDMPWSTDRVCAETLDRATEAGLTVAVLSSVWDVDDGPGYERLRASGLLPAL